MFAVIGIPIKKMLDLMVIRTIKGDLTFHLGLNVWVFWTEIVSQRSTKPALGSA